MKKLIEHVIEKATSIIGRRIHNKILIPYICILLIPAVTGIWLTLKALSEFSEKRIESELDHSLYIARKSFEEIQESVLFYSKFMADAERLTEVLASSETSRNILILLIQTLKENRMTMNIYSKAEPDMPNFSILRKGFLGLRSIGLVVTDHEQKKGVFIEAVAPIEEEKIIRNVISVRFPLDENFLQSLKKKSDCDISLYFPQDIFLSTVNDKECRQLIYNMMKRRINAKRVAGSFNSKGERFKCGLGTFQIKLSDFKMNDVPFGLMAISIPITDVIHAKNAFIAKALIYFTLALIILFVFYNYLIRNITRPLKDLSYVAQRVAKGSLDEKLPVEGSDEIGELIHAFNYMMEELRNYKNQTEQWTKILEKEVEDRTRQLRETHLQIAKTARLAALGELAAGVAHELNNPIGGILGYAQYSLEKIQDKPPEQISHEDIQRIKRYLTYIEKEAQRCRTIVHNLLKFSRGTHMSFETLDVNNILDETIVFTSHILRINNIELIRKMNQDLPPIRGSAHHLQQVFTNIIINAQEAMKGGGRLYIETRPLVEGQVVKGVEIEFTDTGHGIPEEIQDKIFEPFFTTKEGGKGTGLGLSVSYGIIKDHGGDIKVRSKPGEGATFIIFLPVEKT